MAACCCASGVCRRGGKRLEAQASDLCLLEATSTSLTVAFQAPRGSLGRFRSARSPAPPDVMLSVLGGPNCDYFGARVERVALPVGCRRVVHTISGLQPDTEYTVWLSLQPTGPQRAAGDAGPVPRGEQAGLREVTLLSPTPALGAERLEARTSPAAPTLLTKDWECEGGRDGGGKDGAKAPLVYLGKPEGCGTGTTPSPAALREDVSTAVPSEIGEDMRRALDEAWDSASEADSEAGGADAMLDAMQETMETAVAEEMPIIEAAPARRVQCNLCSIFDCWRTTGGIVLEADVDEGPRRPSVAPRPLPPRPPPPPETPRPVAGRRGQRPYRIPFPGVAVDPASVGLEHLERANEAQLAGRLALADGSSTERAL